MKQQSVSYRNLPLPPGFVGSAYEAAFDDSLVALDLNALFDSGLHGRGHIERVMLLGAVLAQQAMLSGHETRLLLLACSYHDVGRADDSVDDEHGLRSAACMERLTGCKGMDLRVLKAVVEAHSRPDEQMAQVLARYGLDGDPAAWRLARLLKDADGLDRVRLNALDPAYLRHPFSKALEPLAWALVHHFPHRIA